MRIKETSIEAYANKVRSGTIDNDIAWIFWALRDKNEPMTYTEIAYHLQWWNPNKVSRRTSEMVEIGLIEECEPRLCKFAKSRCTTYRIKG
jgi:hypothetical protein